MDLLSLLPRLEQELTPLLRAYQVGLAVSPRGQPLGPGAAYLVAGEEALLNVLLENLLKNAIEAAPPVSQVRVSLGETPGDRRRVDIHNLGAVPAEIRSRLFEPYVTSGKREGTRPGHPQRPRPRRRAGLRHLRCEEHPPAADPAPPGRPGLSRRPGHCEIRPLRPCPGLLDCQPVSPTS